MELRSAVSKRGARLATSIRSGFGAELDVEFAVAALDAMIEKMERRDADNKASFLQCRKLAVRFHPKTATQLHDRLQSSVRTFRRRCKRLRHPTPTASHGRVHAFLDDVETLVYWMQMFVDWDWKCQTDIPF